MLAVWGESDEPRRACEVQKILWKKDKFWHKGNVRRYLIRLTIKWLLIPKEKGRGATYSPNRAGITKRNYMEDLENLYGRCLSNELHNFGNFAWGDCRVLGIPPDEKMTPYEQEVVRVIREKLFDAWQLASSLKYVFAARSVSGRERWDVRTLRALYEHKFFEGLHSNIFSLREPSIQPCGNLLRDLVDQTNCLSKKYGIAQPIGGYFSGFKRVIESYPPDPKSLLSQGEFSELLLDETSPLPKNFSESLALLVTQSVTQSEEFRGRIENYIDQAIKLCSKSAASNKFEELATLIEQTCKSMRNRGQKLEETEKERLRQWRKLIDRYGEENVNLFLDLIEKLNLEQLRLFDEFKSQDFSASAWIRKNLEEKLKDKELFERYTREKFDQPLTR